MTTTDGTRAGLDDNMAREQDVDDTVATEPEEDDDVLVAGGGELLSQWERIQGRFVDEPRSAVEEADALVGRVVDDLSRAFAGQRERLERQWKAGEDVSTEELRRALQRYRAFFQRLVAV